MDGKEKTKSQPFDYNSYNIPPSYSKKVPQTMQTSNDQRPNPEAKQMVYETDSYQTNNNAKYYEDGVYEEDEPGYYSFGDYVRSDKGRGNEVSESEECYDSEEYFANYDSGEAQYYELETSDRPREGQVASGYDKPGDYHEGTDYPRHERAQYYQLETNAHQHQHCYDQYYAGQQKASSHNTESSSCPILPNSKAMNKDLIYRQVNKKIDETVAELRNAGLQDNKGRITSDPELDYSKRHPNDYSGGVEGPQQKTFNQKISYAAAQRNRLQEEVYKQLAQQRALKQQIKEQRAMRQYRGRPMTPGSRNRYSQPTHSRDWENVSPPRYENDKIYQKNISPMCNRPHGSRQNKRVPRNEGVHRRMMEQLVHEEDYHNGMKGENDHYKYQQCNSQEAPVPAEHRQTKSVRFIDLKKKSQNVDSFVELHASSDQTIPECCRKVYDDYKKTSYAQKSSQFE